MAGRPQKPNRFAFNKAKPVPKPKKPVIHSTYPKAAKSPAPARPVKAPTPSPNAGKPPRPANPLPPMTEDERKRKRNVIRTVKVLMRRKRRASSTSIDSHTDTKYYEHSQIKQKRKRYRRPVERLLKHIKTTRRRDIPSDINLHRHTHRSDTFRSHPAVRKQVDIILKVLLKHKRNVQPQFGFNYPKKDRRLLLGFRHRPLQTAWHYFDVFKCFARRIRPNDHCPDFVFFFLILCMFISTGFTLSFVSSIDGYTNTVVDMYKYSKHRENMDVDEREGRKYWGGIAPFHESDVRYCLALVAFYLSLLLGLIGVYTADQRVHLGYIVATLYSLFAFAYISISLTGKDSCKAVKQVLTPLLTILTDDYYQTVPALGDNGTTAKDGSGKDIELRTYSAANIMDRIQQSLHCCGVKNISDYVSRNIQVPSSCCNPLWNLNPFCAHEVPINGNNEEYRSKLRTSANVDLGCDEILDTLCKNFERSMGINSFILCIVQAVLFLISLIPLLMQARQIRQLKRWPHLRISKGNISQALQASSSAKAGVKAVADATKFTEKYLERAQQIKHHESIFQANEPQSSSSSSYEEDEDYPVGHINLDALRQVQSFVDREDDLKMEKVEVDKSVVGFAGRFNIVANKNLNPYVPAIFSTTYQNETNIGLEAIAQTLESQFAQHTTDYNWRKLLSKKPKGKQGTGKQEKGQPEKEKPRIKIKKIPRKSESEPMLNTSVEPAPDTE